MGERGRFAGGDQRYLREVQYADPSRLTTRANLHIKYGTAPVAWFPWVVDQIDWPTPGDVLEVGCGPGWLWAEAASSLPTDLRLTLADLSTGMVTVAAERVQSLGRYATVNGQVADAQRLPFADASFDVVLANHMQALRAAVQARFDAGGGHLTVSKETGLFLCRHRRRHDHGRRPR